MKEKLTVFQMIRRIKDYFPESHMFTNNNEIGYIQEELCLKQMTRYELQNLRDMVVMVYTDWMENELITHDDGEVERTNKYFKYMDALQSVTTVIDNMIFQMPI